MRNHFLFNYLLSLFLAAACSHKMEEVAETPSQTTNEVSSTESHSVPLLTMQDEKPSQPLAAKAALKPQRKLAHSVVPQVRTRNGKLLNRFYFVRAEDTKESVAQKLFGDASKGDELFLLEEGHRPGEWEAGRVILYPSSKEPIDKQMKSYFEDMGIPGIKYRVQKGETVSSIAEDRYYDAMSWKEIASLNHLKNANRVQKGQFLMLYPDKTGPLVAVNAPAPATAATQNAEGPIPVAPMAPPIAEEASVGVAGVLLKHWMLALGGLAASFFLFLIFRRKQEEFDYRLK
ncbi:MAG: LysM peptidoglycan-binding domain-containing protein [Deltaproteobacteria bacterium]|nr:LysM peptidoglycan-binding domain-containing protein [Deltaproteobacteria bacterium]